MRGLVMIAVAATGCGRLGFDPLGVSVDSAPVDSEGDAGVMPVRVQVQAPGYASAPMASATVAQTAGNVLVVAVYWDQTPNTVTLGDTAGLVWTSLPKQEIPSVCGGTTGNATGAQLYFAQVTTTASNVVTASQTSGSQPLGLFVLEYAGLATANVVEAHTGQVAPQPSNRVFVPPIVTSTTAVVVAFFGDTENAGVMTGGPGFVVQARDTGFPNMLEDTIGPAGTYAPEGALPNTQSDACWVGAAVALRAR